MIYANVSSVCIIEYMYIGKYVCIYVCIHVSMYVYTDVCVDVCVDVCMDVCMHACMCLCVIPAYVSMHDVYVCHAYKHVHKCV